MPNPSNTKPVAVQASIQRVRPSLRQRSSTRKCRHPPASDDKLRFPGLMEEVCVLWVLGGSAVWWGAEVTDISASNHSDGGFSATIRYFPRKHYKAEDYNVRFFIASGKRRTKTLQHVEPSFPGVVAWKFPEEDVQVHDRLLNSEGKGSPLNSRKEDSAHAKKEKHEATVANSTFNSFQTSSALRDNSMHNGLNRYVHILL